MPGLCHALTEFSPIPTITVEGASHAISYANAAFCRLTHRAGAELIGSPIAETMPRNDGFVSTLDRVYDTGKAVIYTEKMGAPSPHSADGWTFAMWPILGADKRAEAIMIEVTETSLLLKQAAEMNQALVLSGMRQLELTEAADKLNVQLQSEMAVRQQTEQALLSSERLANAARLSTSIAHEINNPLEAVMNTLYLARTSDGLSEPARQYLETAEGELKRIAHITRQALGFYRESSAPTTFAAGTLLDGVLDLMQAKIRSREATIQKQCDEQLQVTANLGELRQILSNLLANSLDALSENAAAGRSVTVKLRASAAVSSSNGKGGIRITIADNGKGIGAATLPHIFEPFFTTKGSIGTGLGLWVSKQLVEKHGGSIRVHSCTSGPRQGTAFSIVLPADAVEIGAPK